MSKELIIVFLFLFVMRNATSLRTQRFVSMVVDPDQHVKLLPDVIFATGKVEQGYGRGSKKLGFPTANLPQFDDCIRKENLLPGVYFGWGRLERDPDMIVSFVANFGKSPTFAGQVCQ